jgi:hypothetical protein
MVRGCCGRRRLTLLGAAVLVLILASVSPASAAPQKSLRSTADRIMAGFMTQWDKDGFAKVVHLGSTKLYRQRLSQCKLKVDPSVLGSSPYAVYGPRANVITFTTDPRQLWPAGRAECGRALWHEVTHALEASHGVDLSTGDALFREHETRYLEVVVDYALPALVRLEKQAKAGASPAKLTVAWCTFKAAMEYSATDLPETKNYPPDLAQLERWFGFSADPASVKALYLTDSRFSGPAWGSLRSALATPVFDPSAWAGTWVKPPGPDYAGKLTLTVSGTSVTGAWGYRARDFTGTISPDGGTMTGNWVDEDRGYSFSVALKVTAAGGFFFDGFAWQTDRPEVRFPFTYDREGSAE